MSASLTKLVDLLIRFLGQMLCIVHQYESLKNASNDFYSYKSTQKRNCRRNLNKRSTNFTFGFQDLMQTIDSLQHCSIYMLNTLDSCKMFQLELDQTFISQNLNNYFRFSSVCAVICLSVSISYFYLAQSLESKILVFTYFSLPGAFK